MAGAAPARQFPASATSTSTPPPPTAEHPSPSTNPEYLRLLQSIDRATVDKFLPVRCPDEDASRRMEDYIAEFRDRAGSIGGTVTCVTRNAPTGLGEPCFDKMEALLAHATMSIPATKGFEIGSGFGGCQVPGSIHNNPFIPAETAQRLEAGADRAGLPRPKLTTKTNYSGGIQGDITNGAPIYFRVGLKPPAIIGQEQTTATYDGTGEGVLAAKGRHDPCVVPRAVPIVEAMAALVVMDTVLSQQSRSLARVNAKNGKSAWIS